MRAVAERIVQGGYTLLTVLNYRITVNIKMRRPDSLLHRLNILSILPCPSERWRILLGASALGCELASSAHMVPSCVFHLAGNRSRTCVCVYDVHSGLFPCSVIHSSPGLIVLDRWFPSHLIRAMSSHPVC